MPEGPEVQTIVNDLKKLIKDQRLVNLEIVDDLLYKNINPQNRKLLESTVKDVYRLGKYIIIQLEQINLAIHLRMTGSIVSNKNKHTRAIFNLENTKLYFNDIRRFGTLETFSSKDEFMKLKKLGMDILSISDNQFKSLILHSKKEIYLTLMENKYITGIGNIYSNEILHSAKINPKKLAHTLNKEEVKRIYDSAQKILNKSIKYRGTSFSDYVDLAGKTGSFQNYLMAYKQAGKKCSFCNNKIVKEKISGRSAFYCSSCQK